MEKRELAEKIVLAMLQSGALQIPTVSCNSTEPRADVVEDMKNRAKMIKALIDAVAQELASN